MCVVASARQASRVYVDSKKDLLFWVEALERELPKIVGMTFSRCSAELRMTRRWMLNRRRNRAPRQFTIAQKATSIRSALGPFSR